MDAIVSSSSPIILIGDGQVTPADVSECLTLGGLCVAADGGAARALEGGVVPDAVIGDFDSLPADVRAMVPADRFHHVSEQDSTDFEKALVRIAAPVAIGAGFLGGRIDHQLAALHVLLAYPDRPCVLLGATEIVLLAPPVLALPTAPGDVVSLFPLAPASGRSSGLRWPIDGLEFNPGGQIGTSNAALGPARIEVDKPGMLLVLPRRLIQPVVAQLAASTAVRWPARAQ